MNIAYTFDADIYCEQCGADIPGAESVLDGGGESDCPQNCGHCGRPLNNPLTTDGVDYVLDAIIDELESGADAMATIGQWPVGHYYHGSSSVACVYDWASDIKYYSLNRCQKFVIDHFLDIAGEAMKQGS